MKQLKTELLWTQPLICDQLPLKPGMFDRGLRLSEYFDLGAQMLSFMFKVCC